MKKISFNYLKAGMITALDVKNKQGKIILEKGTVLDTYAILHLFTSDIQELYVEDESEELPAQAEAVPARPYTQPITMTQQFQTFQVAYSFIILSIKNAFEGFVHRKQPLHTEHLLLQINTLFYSCKTSLDLFDMLNHMRSYEDSTYAHTLNVTLICKRFGIWLKLDEHALDTLTLCGLLHDIGKLMIPAKVLDKPDQYTNDEFELVKKHTRYGYDLLKDLPLDSHVKSAALLHHERCDGSGYPLGSTDDIDPYAMMVAIADVYDAMTAARPHRPPLCPFQVISSFEQNGLQKYPPKYILTFLQHIAQTYQHNRVMLNDGRCGTIVMLNPHQFSRPLIQFDTGEYLDLSAARDYCIQSIL